MLDFAIHIAREAGKLLRDNLGRKIEINHKSRIDLVTEIDLASEQLIKEMIQSHFPKHQILAEEGGAQGGQSQYKWIIDPLDGTTNYAHGYPCFAVSIAIERAGEVIAGVVYDPMRDELFAAERGSGATLNNRPIHVSDTDKLSQALLVTGFPYDIRTTKRNNIDNFISFMMNAQAVRRDGSASLDLCYVACGRFDGFWEIGLNPWDSAAAHLIILEAGGVVTRFDGSEFSIYGNETLATNGLIHAEMMNQLTIGSAALK